MSFAPLSASKIFLTGGASKSFLVSGKLVAEAAASLRRRPTSLSASGRAVVSRVEELMVVAVS